jgi:hypothetical protein
VTVSTPGRSRPPKLLPGMSAFTWSRILFVAKGAVIAFVAVAFMLEISHGFRGGSWYRRFEIPLFTLVWILPMANSFAPFERRETRAGYTTLRRAHPELSQLDPRTSEIVRPAGAPYLNRRGRSPDPLERPTFLHRVKSPVLYAGALVLLASFALCLGTGFGSRGLGIASIFFGSCVVVAALSYAVAGLVGAVRMRRLAGAAANTFRFRFRLHRSSVDALSVAMVNLTRDPAPPGPWGASANEGGLMLWRGRPPELEMAIAWPTIASIQQDSLPGERTAIWTVRITVVAPDGDTSAMQLVAPTTGAIPISSRIETDWIVAQLNSLRQARPGTSIS